jgi:hypothetical protein
LVISRSIQREYPAVCSRPGSLRHEHRQDPRHFQVRTEYLRRTTRTPRASSAWTTTKAAATVAGTTTSQSCWSASRSSSPSGSGLFPPRREKPPPGHRASVNTVRTLARPERHFEDSFITVRQAVARVLATWLPRCPLCHRPQPAPSRDVGPSHRRVRSCFKQ